LIKHIEIKNVLGDFDFFIFITSKDSYYYKA